MKTTKELKQTVMDRLRCCWGENAAIFFMSVGGAAVIVLAWILISGFLRSSGRTDPAAVTVAAVTAGALIILWLIAEPFLYGVKWYRIQQVRGRSVHARSIFTGYGSWRRLGQIFRFAAALFVRRLYFILPLTAALGAGIYIAIAIDPGVGGTGWTVAAVIIFLLAACLICLAASLNRKYSPAPYLFVLDPKASPKEIIDKSVRLTKGREGYLSEALFAGAVWLPACILVFPAVFVVPYCQTLYAAAVNELINNA